MYAGRKVEEAPVDELFAHPQHPYTIGLLGAIPRPGARRERAGCRRSRAASPRSAELPSFCAFADRCPRADELHAARRCRSSSEVRPDHLVACFHPGELGGDG